MKESETEKSRLEILWEGILDVLRENDDYCLTVNLLSNTHKEVDYIFHHCARPVLRDVVMGFEDEDFCIYLNIFPYSCGIDTVLDCEKRLAGAIWVEKGLAFLDVSLTLEKFLNELEKKKDEQ